MPPSAHGLDVASEGPSTALALHKARLLGEIGQTAYHFLLIQRFKMKVRLSSWLPGGEVSQHCLEYEMHGETLGKTS